MEGSTIVVGGPENGFSVGKRHSESVALVENACAKSVEIFLFASELVSDRETVQQAREGCDLLQLAFWLVLYVELRAVTEEVDFTVGEKCVEPAVTLRADEVRPPTRIFEHVAALRFGD